VHRSVVTNLYIVILICVYFFLLHGRDQGLSDKVGFLIWAPAQLSAEGAYAKPSERDYDQHARSKYNTRVCDEINLVIMMGASHKQRKF